MSEVSNLRKSGKLKEAWMLSSRLLSERPGDIWVARDFAWVVYDYMKTYTDSDSPGYKNINAYVKALARVRSLPLGNEEAFFFERAAKNVRFVVWDLAKSGNKGISGLKTLLGELVMWDPRSPLFIQGTLNGLFLGLKKDPDSVVVLMSWWGLDKFTSEDFERRDTGDRKIWSFAEEATHKYLKALSAKNWDGSLKYDENTLERVVDSARKLLSDWKCRDWEWPPLSLGELLKDMGREEEAASFLASVVLANPKQAWSWHAFASALKRHKWNSYIKCLFRGLTVSGDLKLSIRLHEEAMQFFANQGALSMAKAEAELVDCCRRENGWPGLEAATRLLQDCAQIETASTKALRSEYDALSRNAASCLLDYVPSTEFYLEWVDVKNKVAGIVLLGKGFYVGSQGLKSASLSRKTVSYSGLAADSELIVGEVFSGVLDEKKKNLIGGLSLKRNSELCKYVFRETAGFLELFTSEKTSQRVCFLRAPINSVRNEDVYIPAHFDGVEELNGKLVLAKERIVYKRERSAAEDSGLSNGGEWVWTVTSLEELEMSGAIEDIIGAPIQFYVEWVKDDGSTMTVATLPMDAPKHVRGGKYGWVSGLARFRVSCAYANADITAHNVYRGRVFGEERCFVIDPIEIVESGFLWERTVKQEVTGIYELNNGWGHIGCHDGASVPPKIASDYSIEPGSTVSARQYLVFVKDREAESSLAKPRKHAGDHWEWRAEKLRVVAPPGYREVAGMVSIAQDGFGFLHSVDGNFFIPKDLVEANGLMNYDEIRATVRTSWNRKREENGWIVVDVIAIENRGPDYFYDERNWDDLVGGCFTVASNGVDTALTE